MSLIKNTLRHESIRSMGRTWPNPSVAAFVLCRTESDEIAVFSGCTEKPGSRHAEIAALDAMDASNLKIKKAVLFVTLEPCSVFGRTPPCTDRILKYNSIRSVVILNRDPLLSGEGIQKLKNAGKKVFERKYFPGEFRSDPFLGGFLKRVTGGGPRLHFKAAVLSDGVMGSRSSRILISDPESFRFGMALRAKCDAVLAGPGTVAVDSPSLHLRKPEKNGTLNFEILSGRDIFAESILQNLEELEKADSENPDYQPDRIFILDEPFPDSDAFIQKQMDLEIKTGRKPVFFITENSTGSWKHLKKDAVIPAFGNPEFSSALRKALAGKGYNEVLIEGGAGLFRELFPSLENEDRVYILQSSGKFGGRENAVFFPELNREKKFRCRLGKDELSVL